MQIISVPLHYTPAYSDAMFQITAAQNEVVNLDIYNNDNSKIIGRKKVSGATVYNINVANYAKRQFEIEPLTSSTTQFIIPSKRIINVRIESGAVNASTKLSAGIYYPLQHKVLSNCPEEKTIRHNECDEIPFRTKTGTLSAQATLYGNGKEDSLVLSTKNVSEGIVVLVLNMPHIGQILQEKSIGDIKGYDRMELRIMANADRIITLQYKLAPPDKESARICWWNPYGQIDFYTMQRITQKSIRNSKTRIYSPSGYRTVGNSSETEFSIVSAFENHSTMEWLGELISSPKVWIYDNGVFTPIDVTTNCVVTKSDRLTLMNITARETQKTYYPII